MCHNSCSGENVNCSHYFYLSIYLSIWRDLIHQRMQLHYLDINHHPHCKLSFPQCSLILCLFIDTSLPLFAPCLCLYPCRHPPLSVLSSSLTLVPLFALIALPLGI